MRPPVESKVEVAILGENVVPREGALVAIEGPAIAFLPSGVIEVIEVITPHVIEALVAPVVGPHLNIVVLSNEGEVVGVEVVTPWAEVRRPDVHHKLLRLVHHSDAFVG